MRTLARSAPSPQAVRLRLHPLDGSHPIPLVSVETIDEVEDWIVRTAGGSLVRFAGGNGLWIDSTGIGYWIRPFRRLMGRRIA